MHRQHLSRRDRARKLAAAILIASPACVPSVVEAITRTWISNTGTWSNPLNWSGVTLPTTGDDALISNNDAINRIITYNIATLSLHTLTLNNNGAVSNILSQTGSNTELDANTVQVGTTGKAFYTISAGTNSIISNIAGGGLFVGVSAGSSGSYSLSGSGQLITTASGSGTGEMIGSLGAGTFFHSNGTNTISGASGVLVVGAGTTGVGFYSLSGGTVNCNSAEIIGNLGIGTVNHFAGTNNTANLNIGNAPTGVGSYGLSGSAVLATTTGGELIGVMGTGTFSQTGGTNTSARGMEVGSGTGSVGTYNLSGGTLTVLGDGLAPMIVGNIGAGTFIQSGGTLIIGGSGDSEDLQVGAVTNGVGNFVLNGPGVINANNNINVGAGGTGIFNQSAGTVSTLRIGIGAAGTGAAGTYLLSGSGVLNSGTSGIFVNQGGTFIQSGGLHRAGATLAGNIGSITGGCDIEGGYYRLSGGTLEVTGVDGVGNGSFEQLGGLHLVHGVTLILANPGNTSTYLLSGGTFQQVTLTSVLGGSTSEFAVLPGGVLVGGNGFLIADARLDGGTVSGVLQNQGTFSFQSGTFSAQLQNEGTFALNGNTLTTALATNNLDLGVFNGPGTINGAFTNRGVANANGTLSTGTLGNFGLINIGTNSALLPASGANNSGAQIQMSRGVLGGAGSLINVGSSRVDLQACKLEYSIVSPK